MTKAHPNRVVNDQTPPQQAYEWPKPTSTGFINDESLPQQGLEMTFVSECADIFYETLREGSFVQPKVTQWCLFVAQKPFCLNILHIRTQGFLACSLPPVLAPFSPFSNPSRPFLKAKIRVKRRCNMNFDQTTMQRCIIQVVFQY